MDKLGDHRSWFVQTTVPVPACCPRVIVNNVPFSNKIVLVWPINYTVLLQKRKRAKMQSLPTARPRSGSGLLTSCVLPAKLIHCQAPRPGLQVHKLRPHSLGPSSCREPSLTRAALRGPPTSELCHPNPGHRTDPVSPKGD